MWVFLLFARFQRRREGVEKAHVVLGLGARGLNDVVDLLYGAVERVGNVVPVLMDDDVIVAVGLFHFAGGVVQADVERFLALRAGAFPESPGWGERRRCR